ncbi:hypothetical protein PENSPDRAFT_750228 [Peniophora sp. CONT]|nr:hypothetical protein PENSPDRAFT_750228 [Peniophora sp. CONT]
MSNSATKRKTTVTRLPPEVLLEILSHVPHERTKGIHQLGLSERQGVRPFEPQLAFAHVCRAWRNALLGSKYWPGVRLSLKSAEHLEEGLAHDHGKALLYVHINKGHRYFDVMHNGRKDAPELQDFTFRWLTEWGDRKRNELGFITNPLPRLRYLDLWECDLTSRQTILQTDKLVSINFQGVSLSKNIDELVATISRWTRLQYLNLRNCDLIDHDSGSTQYERRAISLPALRELYIYASSTDIAAFLTYIAFPVTAKVDLNLFETKLKLNASRVRDAIRDHFDSPEGLSSTSSAYGFTITYPFAYGIQFQPPPEKPEDPLRGVSRNYIIDPEADFSFRLNDQDISFFEDNLAGFPALDTVRRVDLSGRNHGSIPPAHILRRFAGTICLVINDDCKSILRDIAKDTQIFPKLECLELFDFNLRGRKKDEMIQSLQDARKARPNLAKLVLCECRATKIAFEDVFGEGQVQIKLSHANRWMDQGDSDEEDEEDEDEYYY